jgi:hypothetical protein
LRKDINSFALPWGGEEIDDNKMKHSLRERDESAVAATSSIQLELIMVRRV